MPFGEIIQGFPAKVQYFPPTSFPFSKDLISVIVSSMNKLHPKALVIAAIVCLSACATGVVTIPRDLSPAEIIQRAQEASDRNRYNAALQYYEALLERNQNEIELVCTAEYEIAFIHYKQKKYTQAREEFNALLERYYTSDEESLPQQFQILANIVLKQIDEKEKPKQLFKKKEK